MSRDGRLAVLFLSILLLSILAPMMSISSHAASERTAESMLIDIRLDGPDVVGAGLEEAFTLRISYAYPERIQNFSYKADVTGDNVIGGAVTPANETSEAGIFLIKVRGTTSPGKMTVRVNATAIEAGISWYRVKEFEIEVVKPIYVEAILVNDGEASVNNVSVKMLIDGELERTEHYNLSGGQSISLNFSWAPASISEGEHTITLVVNDPANVVDFSSGDNILTMEVYYSSSGNLLRGVLVIMIIFVAIILVLTVLQKKPAAKGK
jgi:hypothetical protein